MDGVPGMAEEKYGASLQILWIIWDEYKSVLNKMAVSWVTSFVRDESIAHPIRGHEGPEGWRQRYSSSPSLTSTIDVMDIRL